MPSEPDVDWSRDESSHQRQANQHRSASSGFSTLIITFVSDGVKIDGIQ